MKLKRVARTAVTNRYHAVISDRELRQLPTPKAFISYSTRDKIAAGAMKDALLEDGFECFLAHDDVEVSEQWRERILEELRKCEVFIPVLSKSFRESDWASQEIGFAVAWDLPIIPLSLDGTLPYGFIGVIQGRPLTLTSIDVGQILVPLAKRNLRYAAPALIARVREAGSFDYADYSLGQMAPFFGQLNEPEVQHLADAIANNGQVWNSGACRHLHIPAFLDQAGDRIPEDLRRVVEYQLEHDEWYKPEA